MQEYEMKNLKIPQCPRCGCHNVKLTTPHISGVYVKKAKCSFCGLEVTSRSIGYLDYIMNTDREKLLEHCIRDLDRAPYTAFISNDLYDIWGGRDNIVYYIKRKTGYEIVIKEAVAAGNGKILDRIA